MADHPGKADADRPARGWRSTPRAADNGPRHRWESADAESAGVSYVQGFWRYLQTIVWLAVALALMAGLIIYLVQVPVRTPLITIAPTQYAWPLPPNAFTQEDLARLAELDGATVHHYDLTSAWTSGERGLDALVRQLQRLASARPAPPVILLYVSMPGVVDGKGHPCLIPPGASPQHASTWIPVSDLFAKISAQRLPSSQVVVVFDSNRMMSNWSLGVLYNAFAERLPAAVRAAGNPRLHVINSTSAGQWASVSPELQASVFGYFLHQGLRGAADSDPTTGNRDRSVSLHELHAYVAREVNAWSRKNRGRSQTPLLISEESDLALCWSVESRLGSFLRRGEVSASFVPAVSPSQRDALWRRFEALDVLQLYLYDPLAWHALEHRLLALEQLATAGQAYQLTAGELHDTLDDELTRIEQRVTAAQNDPSLPAWTATLRDRAQLLPSGLSVPSLPLATRLGLVDRVHANQARSALAGFIEAPSLASVSSVQEAFTQQPATAALLEPGLLALIARWAQREVWNHPDLVSQAIAVWEEGHAVSIPDSLRSLIWTRAALAQGDRAWRQGFDALLSDAADWSDSANRFHDAQTRYQQATHMARAASDAWAAYDRGAARLMYLAAWFARVPATGKLTSADVEAIVQLEQAARTMHRLADVLAAGPATGGADQADALPFSELVATFQDQLRQLEQTFQAQCRRWCEAQAASPESIEELQAALASPLLPVTLRLEVRNCLAELQARYFHQDAAPEASDAESDEGPSYLEHMVVRLQQPLPLALLTPIDDEPTGESPLVGDGATADLTLATARQEERLRQRLAGLSASIHRLQLSEAAADATAGYGMAERLSRTAAPLVASIAGVDPVFAARKARLEQLMLLEARRTLDDFLGPIADDTPPLFQTAAEGLVRSARLLIEPGAALQAELDQTAELLTRRLNAARRALEVRAADMVVIGALNEATTSISVTANEELAPELPPGRAAVFLADGRGRLPTTTRSLPLPMESVPNGWRADLELGSEALADRGPDLAATALFRGQRFTAHCLLRPTQGVGVDYEVPVYGPSTITVNAQAKRRASIVFILDCSNSMSQTTTVEAPGGDQQMQRMEVAKSALAAMLDRLAKEGTARVGVRFYGHRVGWNTRVAGQVLRQTDYARAIPEGLLPSEDVELVLPLGRFDQVIAGSVKQALESVKPWGETPLYRSITEALADFANEPGDTQPSIVVITDGLNYQFYPPNPTTQADVLAAAEGRNIPIHIVGFGISAQEAAEARRAFGQLADRTGGSYTPADNANALMTTLESLLGPSQFSVEDLAGKVLGLREIGQSVSITPPPSRPTEYRVVYDNLAALVELSGGEAVELLIPWDNSRLLSAPYERGEPRFVPLVQGARGNATGLLLGVHRAVRDAQGVRFPISLQGADQQFVPRPAEVWIEISPVSATGQRIGPAYPLYDTPWVAERPVPLLDWMLDSWPERVEFAAVQAWVKPRRTRSHDVSLGEFVGKPLTTEGLTIPGVPGVSCQVRVDRGVTPGAPFRVAVIERHGDASPGIDAMKVELDPPPHRVVHRFDAQNRIVLHLFSVATAEQWSLATYQLRFTSRRDVVDGAWQTEEPMVVPLSSIGDIIRLPQRPANQ